MKKISICFLLIFSTILASLITSCSPQKNSEETDSISVTTTTVTDTSADSETELSDSLPEKDYKKADYNILAAAEQWQKKYFLEESTGEVVDDAVYARNNTIEDRFNVKFNYSIVNGYMAGMSDVQNKLENSVYAGDAEYDLLVANSAYVGSYITSGVLSNVADSEYLSYDTPWWYENVNENLKINGKLYVCAGSYGLQTIASTWSVFFNKQMADDFNITSIYESVNDGTWTYDKMLELASKVSSDLNGDGVFNENDRYGIIGTDSEPFSALPYGMGRMVTEINSNGLPELTGATERNVDIMDRLQEFWGKKEVYYGTEEMDPLKQMIPMFASGNALFMIYPIRIVELAEMREAVDYGIIPLPKYNTEQDEYYTLSFADISAIPIVVKDAEMSEIILEALNFETYKSVLPQYYNVALSSKYIRDDDSVKMLDIIIDGTVLDFGTVFYAALDKSLYAPYVNFSKAQTSYATWWAKKSDAINLKLKNLIDTLTNIPE